MTRAHWTRLREYLRMELTKAHALADRSTRRGCDAVSHESASSLIIEAQAHRARAAAMYDVGDRMSRIVRALMTRDEGRRRGGRREP